MALSDFCIDATLSGSERIGTPSCPTLSPTIQGTLGPNLVQVMALAHSEPGQATGWATLPIDLLHQLI
ncbi:hypothetical protein Naga_100639g4 [Nannochloropsis gaditana]|uniref:Uncharacterized protein n=1 Tax=Nannochloropsis gaditana TaxID=72520 RepID=W7TPQ5_9STRA|nr:hypothetical protein Naga_100639g4 [Nannochloropsis gaditana]